MIGSILTLLALGIAGIAVVWVVLTVVGVAVGVASTLLFKVAPILLVGWVVLKLIERKKDRNYLSDADRRWLEGE